MPNSTATPKVFVSYSRADTKEVLPLVDRLEKETGVHFWIDREGIESAAQFEEVIISAIDRAEVVLFMLSDNSQHSQWTKDEITYAKNTGKRVVPVVLHGRELKGWFLFKFGRINYIDATQDDQLQRLSVDICEWLHVKVSETPDASESGKEGNETDVKAKANALSLFFRKHRMGCTIGLTIALTLCVVTAVVLPRMFSVHGTPPELLFEECGSLAQDSAAIDLKERLKAATIPISGVEEGNPPLETNGDGDSECVIDDIVGSTGSIRINCRPDGSTVKVDGTSVGITPGTISDLRAGKHTVEVSKSGYESRIWTVDVKANGMVTLSEDLLAEQSQSAGRVVSGTVLNSNKEPLVGALIAIKGSNSGTLTGFDGNFNLRVPDDNAILIISYVDFKTLEVSATSDLSAIVLSPSSSAKSGTINGHEWVDLGLSVRWAACNVGANSPSDYGNYYAWGETTTKSTYTQENSRTCGKDIGNIAGNASYDAARANWGGTWRLPTKAEMQELVDKCTWTWTTQGGHNGCRVTGPNSNSIFLPASGHNSTGNGLIEYLASESFSDSGNYWSSEPDDTPNSYCLFFNSKSLLYVLSFPRLIGRSVRPVSE